MALRTLVVVASLLGGGVFAACAPAEECANGAACGEDGGKGGRRASTSRGGSTSAGKGGGGTSSGGGSGGSPGAGGSAPRGGGGGDPFLQAGSGGSTPKAGSGGVSSKGGTGGTSSKGGGSGAPAQAGAPGTAGTSGDAGSGSVNPPDPTDPWEEGRVLCVKQINEYRATVGKLPLERWADAEKCADAQALNDAKSGKPHEGFQTLGGCGQGQNECPGYASIPGGLLQCLGQMWAEGPTDDGSWDVAHGHYMNMRGDWTLSGYTVNFTRVACGFGQVDGGGVWGVQNFN